MPGPERITIEEYRRLKAAGRIRDPKGRNRVKLPPGVKIPALTGKLSPLPLTITFPWPPSENNLWATVDVTTTGSAKRVLTTKARAYRRSIQHLLLGVRLDPAALYRPTWTFTYPWYFKNGKLRRIDEPNHPKFLQDCFCEAAGVDDSHLKAARHFSIDSGRDGAYALTLTVETLTKRMASPPPARRSLGEGGKTTGPA